MFIFAAKAKTVIELLDEKRLADLCSEHDRKAEEELYTRYAGRLYALCLRYSSNPDDAKDLMQDALIKALNSIGSYRYRGNGSLYAWIKRITVNMAINRITRQKLHFIPFDVFRMDRADDTDDDSAEMVPEKVLLKMISELSPMKRAVFNMFCIDGYSHMEIAQQLGITENGSASILSKAKAQLKRQIKDYIRKSELQ